MIDPRTGEHCGSGPTKAQLEKANRDFASYVPKEIPRFDFEALLNPPCEYFCGVCFTGNTPTVYQQLTDEQGFNVYQCNQCHSYRYEEVCSDFFTHGDTIQMDGPV